MNEVFETERLRIVKFTINDTDLLLQLNSNPDVMKFFPKLLNKEETHEMICRIVAQYEQYGHSFWKVLLKPDNTFIGMAGLLHQEVDSRVETEIAYRILSEHWNQGYATEAAKACRHYAQNILGKKRLISLILPENIASKRVALKLGAVKEKSVQFNDLYHDLFVY